MFALGTRADAILRAQPDPITAGFGRQTLSWLIGFVCLGGGVYGGVMGSFGALDMGRGWQIIYSAIKVPLLLLGTLLICLPSFFVLNTVAGLRADFGRALAGLLASQAALTMVLCSLAPFTAVWYLSVEDYHAAVLFNGAAFALASISAQLTLRRHYLPLIRANRKHRLLLRVWLALYAFVGMQLGWVLRPFVGQPNAPVQWFRADAWGNAYVEILHHMTSLLTR
jgi:hypothetical protein